ncbi:MAG: hypothetical protein IJA34_08030 [Lachnospiraceae bacterium]|nr:hypothetical protein [Lachnospiraceae bacterium]
MENSIDLTMADRLQELRDEKEQLETALKETNGMIEAVEQDLVAAMVTAELDSFKRNGHTYSLKVDTYASAKAECKQELFDALRSNNAGDLVQEQVNANSLRAFVKELKANNDDEIPEWIVDYINVYEKTKVSVRKSN